MQICSFILVSKISLDFFLIYLGAVNGVCKQLREKPGLENLVDLGGCTLHTVNNANRAATKKVFPEIPDLLDDVYSFFEKSHKRRHEFLKVNNSNILMDEICTLFS